MAIKLESGLNDTTSFRIDGLSYQKGLYEIAYYDKELDANGNIIEDRIKVGLRNKTTNELLESPVKIGQWVNGSDTPYPDLITLLTDLTTIVFKLGGGNGSSGVTITQKADNFSLLDPGSMVGEISYAENSQGTAWLPGSVGGTYYPAGFYVWDGTVWVSDRNAIANQIEQNILGITGNDVDIANNASAIAQEIADRISADLLLQSQITDNANNIVQEISDRQASDLILANGLLDKANIIDLNQEIADRIAGDSALQSQITLNDNEIAQVIIDIATEIANRASADLFLQNQIDSNDTDIAQLIIDLTAETANRIAGDSSLLSQITSNDSDIAQLQTDLAQEILDRVAGDTGTVSIHSDMDTTPASANPKEVLTNNGLDIFSPRTLGLDDLDDVNTQGVIPEAGWIKKYNGTEYIPAMKKSIVSKAISINTTLTPQIKISQAVNFQRIGTYSFDFDFGWSYDVGTADFVAVLTVGGSTLATVLNGEIIRQEPKDAGGNDGDGRGTDQKHTSGNKLYFDIIAIGNQDVVLTFQSTLAGVEASIWDAQITVEEEFGIINI